MLIQLLVTVAVLIGLMLGWYLVQQAVRHVSADVPEGCDVLERRVGCHGCILSGHCPTEPGAGRQNGVSPRPHRPDNTLPV